jgi:DNA-binding response OmpR family regulator
MASPTRSPPTELSQSDSNDLPTPKNFSQTLLVVDDDPTTRELEALSLRKSGYEVLEASDAEEAQRLALRTKTIHLLLTDFVMPGANGLELARWFRMTHPTTRVLIVSGCLDLMDGDAAGLDGLAVLAKPSLPDELIRKVRALLADGPLPE